MMTTLLVVWAVLGPSVGLAAGAWWCSREREEPVRVASRQTQSLGWR